MGLATSTPLLRAQSPSFWRFTWHRRLPSVGPGPGLPTGSSQRRAWDPGGTVRSLPEPWGETDSSLLDPKESSCQIPSWEPLGWGRGHLSRTTQQTDSPPDTFQAPQLSLRGGRVNLVTPLLVSWVSPWQDSAWRVANTQWALRRAHMGAVGTCQEPLVLLGTQERPEGGDGAELLGRGEGRQAGRPLQP